MAAYFARSSMHRAHQGGADLYRETEGEQIFSVTSYDTMNTMAITAKTKIVVRGATYHFPPPYSRSILQYARDAGIKRIVISTGMASQALRTYLRRFRKPGQDAQVEPLHCFQGDEHTLEGALTGKPNPTTLDVRAAHHCMAGVIRRIQEADGRVLVLCQMGRNRSFTTAFMYYLVYKGAGRSVVENLAAFMRWPGVSYDLEVQRDGHQRLDERRPNLPWMRDLARIFEDPHTGKVTHARIRAFMVS